EKVDYFVEKGDLIIPKRQEQLSFLVDLFPWQWDEPIRVLDLGAGYGAVTETIRHLYFRAQVVCVDGSEAMIQHARTQLIKHEEHVKILRRDLAGAVWQGDVAGLFHAAVSAIALHHLTDERKRQLCHEVFALLLPGGLFLNNDVVEPPPFFQEH